MNLLKQFLRSISTAKKHFNKNMIMSEEEEHLLQQSKRVFTREISSWDETRLGMKSFLSTVKCLLLFTRFCRDEISSRDELIPGWKTGMRFYPGMKKRKKDV